MPLQWKYVGEVGVRVDLHFHDRRHPFTPALVYLAPAQVIDGLLKIVRFEVAEEREAVAEDRVVADPRFS